MTRWSSLLDWATVICLQYWIRVFNFNWMHCKAEADWCAWQTQVCTLSQKDSGLYHCNSQWKGSLTSLSQVCSKNHPCQSEHYIWILCCTWNWAGNRLIARCLKVALKITMPWLTLLRIQTATFNDHCPCETHWFFSLRRVIATSELISICYMHFCMTF